MKQYFLLTVLAMIALSSTLFSSVVVAQTPPPPKTSTQNAVLLASVDVKDPVIVSQQGSTMEISFTLTNGAVQQAGVRYGVTLISQKDKDTQIVVDEKVYETPLTLAENSSTPVTLTYTAPAQLAGAYDVYITSQNNKGFPFGMLKAGEIILAASVKGVTIATDTCYTHVSSDPVTTTHRLLLSPTLHGENTLELVCSAANTSDESVTMIPTFETRYSGAYGAVAEAQGGNMTPIVFGAKETKTVTIVLPKAAKPQMYAVNVSLSGLGATSNTVTAHYHIPGSIAQLWNVNLDKDFYTKGEIATASIVWGGSFKEIQGTISIKGSNGRACTDTTTQTLVIDPAKMMTLVELPIERDCYAPKLAVTLKDAEGTVLDMQEYEFATTSVPKPTLPWQTAALIVGGVIVLGAGALYVRNRLNTQHHENIV